MVPSNKTNKWIPPKGGMGQVQSKHVVGLQTMSSGPLDSVPGTLNARRSYQVMEKPDKHS